MSAPARETRLPGATSHEGFDDVSPQQLARVFGQAVRAFDEQDVPYVVLGGMASAIHGRPRCSGDIDVLVRPIDAPRALDALRDAGFSTEQTNPHWIFKGSKDGVLVDVLFKAKGDVYLDDEMLARAPEHPVMGHPARVMPAEDLLVIKALVHDEETPRHWFDALGILRQATLDWSYLLERSRRGPRRMLALLFYAVSLDLMVPREVLATLCERVLEGAAPDARDADGGAAR